MRTRRYTTRNPTVETRSAITMNWCAAANCNRARQTIRPNCFRGPDANSSVKCQAIFKIKRSTKIVSCDNQILELNCPLSDQWCILVGPSSSDMGQRERRYSLELG